MKKELYQWQEECLERRFSNNGRGIVQAVTGAGKTFLALTAAARLEKRLGRRLRENRRADGSADAAVESGFAGISDGFMRG